MSNPTSQRSEDHDSSNVLKDKDKLDESLLEVYQPEQKPSQPLPCHEESSNENSYTELKCPAEHL